MDAGGNVWGVHVVASKKSNHAVILQFSFSFLDVLHRILSSHFHHAAFRSIVGGWIFAEIHDEMSNDMGVVLVNAHDIGGNGKSRVIYSISI
jgi:hypothetical protein